MYFFFTRYTYIKLILTPADTKIDHIYNFSDSFLRVRWGVVWYKYTHTQLAINVSQTTAKW